MTSYPRITVITPSFNQGKFIERTIKSVVNQNYPNLEYFVMDAGSTDDTVDTLKKYTDQITYWESKKDSGQSNAINKGILKSSGEIITWLNSDDYLADGALHIAAEAYVKDQFDVLVGNCIFIDEKGTVINNKKGHLINNKYYEPYNPNCLIIQPATFFTKKSIELTGLLDESLHYTMDFDFWMKLAARGGKFIYTDNNLAYMTRHSNAKSSKGDLMFVEESAHSEYFQNKLKIENKHYYTHAKRNLINYLFLDAKEGHKTKRVFLLFFKFVWKQPRLAKGTFEYCVLKMKLFVNNKLK